MLNNTQKKTLLTDCPDDLGLIAKITNICHKHQLNVVQNKEFVDHEHRQFFMRTELEGIFNDETFLADLDYAIPTGSRRKLVGEGRKKVVIMVTKEAHCLGDILMKAYDGTLDVEIAAVIGNYDDLSALTDKFGIPFHHIGHENLTRAEHEELMMNCIEQYEPDFVILAKYMRILTPAFVEAYPHRVINIHHSFLPAFIGAKPYHQAYQRGVKIIGATAHFVTNNLDEGPIITQTVLPVDHTFSATDMARAGRDVEKSVLSKALGLILDDRVFVHGNRTVVL